MTAQQQTKPSTIDLELLNLDIEDFLPKIDMYVSIVREWIYTTVEFPFKYEFNSESIVKLLFDRLRALNKIHDNFLIDVINMNEPLREYVDTEEHENDEFYSEMLEINIRLDKIRESLNDRIDDLNKLEFIDYPAKYDSYCVLFSDEKIKKTVQHDLMKIGKVAKDHLMYVEQQIEMAKKYIAAE